MDIFQFNAELEAILFDLLLNVLKALLNLFICKMGSMNRSFLRYKASNRSRRIYALRLRAFRYPCLKICSRPFGAKSIMTTTALL